MPERILYLYVVTPVDENVRKFHLHRLEGEEQISGPFHYSLTLRSEDGNVDFSKIVGQPVTVIIEQFSGIRRYINGIVFRFIQGVSDEKITTYYAEIRPWLWELTLTINSKIFQNKSVKEIIPEVFDEFGFKDFEDRTKGSYKQREYCVQYQETAFDFVSRLMEEEGIFYFFEHTDNKHVMILADDMDAHQSCPGLEAARMRYVSPDELDETSVSRCQFEQQMIPNKYAVDDFFFKTPKADLLTRVDGKEKGNFRIYEYPGKFKTTGEGEALTDKRIEMVELPQKLLRGESLCRAFIAGYKFDLIEHRRGDMNMAYALRRLSIMADQDGYYNSFEAFPADVPFRPPKVTKKPRIHGTQTAIVTGKEGEEIWPDKYGRVRVRFHWDQDDIEGEKRACWIRVSQMWAGKKWGTMFIPRIGMEVIVSFLDGDPDQPVITGTVYNALQTVPYELPAEKTKSTIKTNSTLKGEGGYNEIRFEDKKGEEEIFIHAQKDQNEEVENDLTTLVRQNRETTIESGNDTLKVETGNRNVTVKGDTSLMVQSGNRSITIQAGSDAVNVQTGGRSITVKGSASLTVQAGGRTVSVTGGGYSASSDTSITLTAPSIVLSAGGSTISMGSEGVIIKGKMIHLNP